MKADSNEFRMNRAARRRDGDKDPENPLHGVLHETYRRQVEKVMEALSERPEGLYG